MFQYVKLILRLNSTAPIGITGFYVTEDYDKKTNKVKITFDPDSEALFHPNKIIQYEKVVHKDYFKIITLDEYNKSKFSLRMFCKNCEDKNSFCLNPIYNPYLCHNCRGPDDISLVKDQKILDLRKFDEPWPH